MKTPQSEEIQNTPYFQNAYTRSTRVIHTPSVFARRSLLYLQEAGNLTALKPHVNKRSHLESYLFFVVMEGSGTVTYCNKSYELTKGDCLFIDCKNGYSQASSNHKDRQGNYDSLWSVSWIHFNGPTMQEIYDKYLERGGSPVFSGEHMVSYYDLVQNILSIARSDSYVRDVLLAEKLTTLLSLLMKDAWQKDESSSKAPKRELVTEIKMYIDEHYQEKLSLEILARQFYINKQYLAYAFKEKYGYTVNNYIVHVRINKAKSLLRFSEETMEQISRDVGIEDANYFSRLFKKVEGISPNQYRKMW